MDPRLSAQLCPVPDAQKQRAGEGDVSHRNVVICGLDVGSLTPPKPLWYRSIALYLHS